MCAWKLSFCVWEKTSTVRTQWPSLCRQTWNIRTTVRYVHMVHSTPVAVHTTSVVVIDMPVAVNIYARSLKWVRPYP